MNAQPEIRFVSVKTFWKDMLGVSSRSWYYRHINDPGMPQPVDMGGRTMLVYQECVDYMAAQVAARDAAREPQKKNPPEKPRRVGRPVSPPR